MSQNRSPGILPCPAGSRPSWLLCFSLAWGCDLGRSRWLYLILIVPALLVMDWRHFVAGGEAMLHRGLLNSVRLLEVTVVSVLRIDKVMVYGGNIAGLFPLDLGHQLPGSPPAL